MELRLLSGRLLARDFPPQGDEQPINWGLVIIKKMRSLPSLGMSSVYFTTWAGLP